MEGEDGPSRIVDVPTEAAAAVARRGWLGGRRVRRARGLHGRDPRGPGGDPRGLRGPRRGARDRDRPPFAERFGDGVVGPSARGLDGRRRSGRTLPPRRRRRIAAAAAARRRRRSRSSRRRPRSARCPRPRTSPPRWRSCSCSSRPRRAVSCSRSGGAGPRRILPGRCQAVLAGKAIGSFQGALALAVRCRRDRRSHRRALGPAWRGPRGPDPRGDGHLRARDLVRAARRRPGPRRRRSRSRSRFSAGRSRRRAGARGHGDTRPVHAARLVPARPRRSRRRRRRPRSSRRSARCCSSPWYGRHRLRPSTSGRGAGERPAQGPRPGRINLLRQLRDRSDAFFVFVLPTIVVLALGLQFGGPRALGVVSTLRATPRPRSSRCSRTHAVRRAAATSRRWRPRSRAARARGGVVIPDGFADGLRATARPGPLPWRTRDVARHGAAALDPTQRSRGCGRRHRRAVGVAGATGHLGRRRSPRPPPTSSRSPGVEVTVSQVGEPRAVRRVHRVLVVRGHDPARSCSRS